MENCYHCGDECGSDQLQFDEKQFCCHGCKTVYEVLKDNDLCTYYDLEESPGISLKTKIKDQSKFDYLDQKSIQEKLIDYKDEQQMRITFYLPQVHCKSCLWLLEKLYVLEDAIIESRVDFIKKEIFLAFDYSKRSLREIVQLLTTLGYEPLIRLSDSEGKNRRKWDKDLMIRLGISAFCFGNIMLLSLPEYLPGSFDLEQEYARMFSILSFFIAIPVVLIGAKDYLTSAYQGVKRKFINIDVPISIGILTLFISSSIDVFVFEKAGYFDSLAGLIFFLLIGKVFQQQTYYQFSFDRDYKSYFPIAVRKIVDNTEQSIALEDVKAGDLIMLKHQELVPADAILISDSAEFDYSFVTGESKPVVVHKGEKVYAGGKHIGGSTKISTIKEPSKSYLTSLWNKEEFDKQNQSQTLDNLSDRVSRHFTFIIIFIALGSGMYWSFIDWTIALKSFTSVLIIACPCALALAIPFTYGNAMRLLGKRSYYFKHAGVIEALSRIKSVIFDKTGTLTDNSEFKVSYEGQELSPTEKSFILSSVNLSTHPLSVAICQYLQANELIEPRTFQEVTGKGSITTFDTTEIKLGSSDFLEQQLDNQTAVYINISGEYKGRFLFEFSYRKGINSLVGELQDHYKLGVLTGDDEGEKAQLKKLFGSKTQFWFKQSPFDKLEKIKALDKESPVLMVGDGLNDAGALKVASVGLSVTQDIANFTPASDLIVYSDEIGNLGRLLLFSKSCVKVVYINFIISFLYNIVGLVFAVSGALSPVFAAVLMPLSSVTVVIFSVIATNYLSRK